MKLTLALPDHAQSIADFYQSIHDASFPHQELFDAATVARLLADQELSVIIASGVGKILGCGVGFPQTWNQSFEIGALSVDTIDDRSQVGRALFEALRRLGLKTYGVAYFRANSESAFKRGRNIGAVCWGLRVPPGARSYGEAELLMGFFENRSDAMRIHPPENSVTQMPFAARIVNALEGADTDVPYPKNFPVGSPRGTGSPVISGQIWPTYHSAGNFISIESTAGPYPIEIIREFVGKVRKKGVADIRLNLPVNQDQAFIDLLDFGFTPIAYVPGWYLRGPHRFDCISMISGLPRASRSDETFIGRAARKILDGLKVQR